VGKSTDNLCKLRYKAIQMPTALFVEVMFPAPSVFCIQRWRYLNSSDSIKLKQTE